MTSFFMCNDKKYLLGHPLYRFMQRSEKWMDRYFVDPLLGLLLPGGWGDALSGLLALPAIYYSLWVVRSVPLTLAVTLNVLADVVLGLLPFMAGDVIDFFFRSYGRNMRLITGYVNGDKQVVAHVRRKAALSAVAIVVLLALLVVLMWLAWQLGQWVWQWLQQALQ
ncbi:MAG: DUF4112 domain-containing protein [Sodaliphilus pleomorphus]|uniref:DUF4112 domain-containing protein n=1 Tax=Sodaliphilus pleomorphus TaxID=2606626 RepID=UPI0023F54B7D|nr:DUF4112 domain-containing protein [Sodaliphilus pleomorphus]MDD7066342.1 DUF4112 domain-containing protein [Sodaliphilus pleomorphus]MDY2831709.1 DUF4112 domain-containing protein [Sodaliphilus pleomorphus]